MYVQLLPENIKDKNEEKYAKITVIVPHFIMIYEFYPNKKVDILSSEEIKIGEIILKGNSCISKNLFVSIFLLKEGTNRLES